MNMRGKRCKTSAIAEQNVQNNNNEVGLTYPGSHSNFGCVSALLGQ